MQKRISLSVLLLIVVVIAGCKTQVEQAKIPYDRPLPPGASALRKITNPHEIPDFTMACLDVSDLREAIGRSLNYLSKPSSRQFFPCSGISHSQAVESLDAFAGLLDSGLTGRQLNQAIREQFRLHDTDTGSPEVQIALLTQRIMDLTGHVTANKRDHASRRGLLKLVGRRRRLLDYLKRESPETYQRLIAHLDLRR